jgi:hypothetical protein
VYWLKSGKIWRTIAEELLLIQTADNDKGGCSCVLILLGSALCTFLAPFTLYNLKRGFESVVDQTFYQAVIDTIMQFDLPDNWRG